MSKSINSLRKEYSSAESRSDFFDMVRLNFELLIAFIRSENLKMARREVKTYRILMNHLSAHLHPYFADEEEVLQIKKFDRYIESEIYDLAKQAHNYFESGSIERALKLYEIAFDLSQARLGTRFIEELDIANDLARCYLKLRRYAKALRVLQDGPSIDGGYQQISNFCTRLTGEVPKTLRHFLRDYKKNSQGEALSDGWASIR